MPRWLVLFTCGHEVIGFRFFGWVNKYFWEFSVVGCKLILCMTIANITFSKCIMLSLAVFYFIILQNPLKLPTAFTVFISDSIYRSIKVITGGIHILTNQAIVWRQSSNVSALYVLYNYLFFFFSIRICPFSPNKSTHHKTQENLTFNHNGLHNLLTCG